MANESTESRGDSRRGAWFDALFFNHLQDLAHQALLFLGRVPHPQTGQTLFDPELARQMVDTIEAITARAEASFTPAEKADVERLLDQLHMLYVEVAGGPPRQAAEGPAEPVEPAASTPGASGGVGTRTEAVGSDSAVADREDPSRKVRFHKSYG